MSNFRFNQVFVTLMIFSFISAFIIPPHFTDMGRVQFEGLFMPISRPAYHLANLVRGKFVKDDEPDSRPAASVASENLALRQEVIRLQGDIERLEKLVSERQSLGDLEKLCDHVTVTGTDSGTREGLTIGGSVLGNIREGQPVLCSEGMAGRIDRVGVTAAHVKLITDPGSIISGRFIRFQRDGKAIAVGDQMALVQGAGNGQMTITNLPLDQVKDIQQDDWVVVADPTWPGQVRNVRLGRVASIHPLKKLPLFAEIRLVPENGLTRLVDVWVMTRQQRTQMRWISYFILAYIALGLQTGLARAMEYHTAAPNLVLLAVIFIGINAPRDTALLGCFILGLMQDVTSQETMGLYSLSYGIVAMFLISTRNTVYREHPLTHFTLALIGGLVTAIVLALHGYIHPPAPREYAGQHLPVVRPALMPLFYMALYSAILAPVVIGILQKMKKVFQFQSARRRVPGFRF